jgi:hypothetical protein
MLHAQHGGRATNNGDRLLACGDQIAPLRCLGNERATCNPRVAAARSLCAATTQSAGTTAASIHPRQKFSVCSRSHDMGLFDVILFIAICSFGWFARRSRRKCEVRLIDSGAPLRNTVTQCIW